MTYMYTDSQCVNVMKTYRIRRHVFIIEIIIYSLYSACLNCVDVMRSLVRYASLVIIHYAFI